MNQSKPKEEYVLKKWEERIFMPIYLIVISPIFPILAIHFICLLVYFALLLLDKQDPFLAEEHVEEKREKMQRDFAFNYPGLIFCLIFWALIILKISL